MSHIEQLWERYKSQNDRAAREELIVHYAPQVKYVVGRLAVRLPRGVDQEDLLGYGTVGLVEAVDGFDPARGVKFETYARARIQGRMVDSLRALDLLPRSARRHVKELEKTFAALTQELGRAPADEEVAERLGISLEQYQDRLLDANSGIISLEQPLNFDVTGEGEPFTLYDSLADSSVPTPTEEMEKMDMKSRLAAAIQSLPHREQLMVSLYYNDELTMKEIGEVLGVSESRVSQMHAKAMVTLLGRMRQHEEPAPVYSAQGNRVALKQLQRAYSYAR